MLPDPYPDELCYSVLARLADRMGFQTAAQANLFAFGLPRVSPTIEFPPRLDALIPRILPGSPFDVDTLITKHSLVPYFASFLSIDRGAEARGDVVAGRAIAAFNALRINTIDLHLRMRFCGECLRQDVEQLREPYWRRSHQLPATLVCIEHDEALQDGVDIRKSDSPFFSASRMLSQATEAAQASLPRPTRLLREIARCNLALLERRDGASGGDLLPRFFEIVHAAGWAAGRRLSMHKVMKRIHEVYGKDALSLVDVHHHKYNSITDPARRGCSTDWIASCLRVRGSCRHPLPYVLLMAALELDPGLLLGDDGGQASPNAAAALPAPCVNAVCPDRDPTAPRPVVGGTPGTMYLIRCGTCGFAYRQGANNSIKKSIRIVEYGELLDRAIIKECDEADANQAELTRRLGLSTHTIKRRAIELGVWNPRWEARTREPLSAEGWDAKREHSRARYRAKWKALARLHPGEGRVKLGRRDLVTYAFLRKRDAAWLDAVTPRRRRRRVGRASAKAAAAKADATLAELIAQAAAAMRLLPGRPRITKTALMRQMGKSRLKIDAGRRPRSAAACVAVIETVADHSLRVRRQQFEIDQD